MCLGVSDVSGVSHASGGQGCVWGSVMCVGVSKESGVSEEYRGSVMRLGVSGEPRASVMSLGVSDVYGGQCCVWGSVRSLRISRESRGQ